MLSATQPRSGRQQSVTLLSPLRGLSLFSFSELRAGARSYVLSRLRRFSDSAAFGGSAESLGDFRYETRSHCSSRRRPDTVMAVPSF